MIYICGGSLMMVALIFWWAICSMLAEMDDVEGER